MAKHKFKITTSGKAWVNVIDGENDNNWEIKHPQTQTEVDIPTGERRWVAVAVLGAPRTEFELEMDDKTILKGKTDSQGKYSNMVSVKG